MCTHLQRRGNRYFLRRAVPQDLRAHYGRREITRALGTSDRRTAVVLCRRVSLELDDAFRLARNQQPVHFVPPAAPPAPATVISRPPMEEVTGEIHPLPPARR